MTDDGKRYSRRTTTAVDPTDSDSLDAALAPVCRDRVEHYRTMAARVLESLGLPAAPVLYWWQEPQEWRPELPPPEARRPHTVAPDKAEIDRLHQLLDAVGGRRRSSKAPITAGLESRSLSYHLAKEGHARDSSPDLAARIIVLAHLIRQAKRESLKLDLVMELQEAATLMRVYGMESSAARRSGGQSKAHPWARELARELKAKHASFPAAWHSIPEGEGNKKYNCHEVWRDGDKVYASHLEAGDTFLTRDSFRTGYFSKVKL